MHRRWPARADARPGRSPTRAASFDSSIPPPDAPARELGELIVGAYDDPEALGQLAAGAAVVTYEFENVPVEAVRSLAPLPPPLALELGQDRLVEKQLFQRLGIPTARFGSLAESGLPAIVKSRRLGYDGKGQRRVALDEELGEHELAEEIVPFDRELSIIARARPERRDPLLAARRERAPRRDPARLAVAGGRRTAGGGRGACRPAARGARLRRRARARAVRGRRHGCLRTSTRRASTTRATGRSTVRSRVSSRTTSGRSSACRSGRPTRSLPP